MDLFLLLADRNSPVNVWLRENPLVLSGMFGLIGLVLLWYGYVGIVSGQTRDKKGKHVSGLEASFMSWVRAIGGVGLILVAIYIALFGAW